MPRTFDLATVLSITTHRLVTDMDNVYRILGYMTASPDITTVGLLVAEEPCRDALLAQFPELAAITGEGCDKNNWQEWLSAQTARLPATFAVKSLKEV